MISEATISAWYWCVSCIGVYTNVRRTNGLYDAKLLLHIRSWSRGQRITDLRIAPNNWTHVAEKLLSNCDLLGLSFYCRCFALFWVSRRRISKNSLIWRFMTTHTPGKSWVFASSKFYNCSVYPNFRYSWFIFLSYSSFLSFSRRYALCVSISLPLAYAIRVGTSIPSLRIKGLEKFTVDYQAVCVSTSTMRMCRDLSAACVAQNCAFRRTYFVGAGNKPWLPNDGTNRHTNDITLR